MIERIKHPKKILFAILFISISCLMAACKHSKPGTDTPPPSRTFPTITGTEVPTATHSTTWEQLTPTPTPIPATATFTQTPEPTQTTTPSQIEEVSLTTSDGMPLAGWLFHPTGSPDKPLSVILAHQLNSSHYEWRPFAALLADQGYTVLAFDFRGQGRSRGVLDYSSVGIDVGAAVRYLKTQGNNKIVCMGASMGGSGCLAAALTGDLAGIANLSGPMNIPGTRLVTAEDLTTLTIPKLFMIAEDDNIPDWPTFVSDFVTMHDQSPEPKNLFIYPGQAHGTALMRTDFGDEVQKTLLDFLGFQILLEETRVLFIGNSLTFTNDLPEVFAEISRSGGHPVVVEMAAQGGWTLEEHAASSQTLDLITNGDWDYVVLQEQSRRPAILESRRNQMIPAVRILDEAIAGNGAVTVLFMTWGNQEGLPEAGYPDYLSMQAGLQAGYLEAAEAVNAPIVPVGIAWEQTASEDLAVNLWQPDGIHPSQAGTYLAACVFYTWFFQGSPEGLDYPQGLSADTAVVLQGIAAQTILGE